MLRCACHRTVFRAGHAGGSVVRRIAEWTLDIHGPQLPGDGGQWALRVGNLRDWPARRTWNERRAVLGGASSSGIRFEHTEESWDSLCDGLQALAMPLRSRLRATGDKQTRGRFSTSKQLFGLVRGAFERGGDGVRVRVQGEADLRVAQLVFDNGQRFARGDQMGGQRVP